jgi:hypothetical protein
MYADRQPKQYFMSDHIVYHVQADNLVMRQIAGETIVVPIASGVGELNAIYTLNPMGTIIWEMLGVAVPDRAIINRLCQEYEITPEAAARDLAEFLDSLRAAGLICSSLRSGD